MITATLCAAFQRTAHDHADAIALRTPDDAVSLTWAEVAERVEQLAGGLAARGIGRGDTVAMMLLNRPEFNLLDWAALHLGATPFSLYVTSPPEQVAYLLENADCGLVITERAFVDIVLAAGADPENVIVVDGPDAYLDETPADFDFDAAWRAVEADDLACLIYTSGTTGPPKGVQLSHRNLIAAWNAACGANPPLSRTGRYVTYLPHAHLADRMAAHYPALLTGSSITCVADPRAIVERLPDIRPTYWMAVPRIWEKLKPALAAKLAAGVTPEQLRAGLGLDDADVLVSGAAPIGADVLEFFARIDLEIVEAYGMSETSAVATVTRKGKPRIGTVGPPYPGVEVSLADDGEVLVRGDVVMRGYRKEPEQTAAAIDADGWMHTGDLGVFDDEGNLRIVDRKKELIINASGKNMSPANIESAIKSASPLIGHVVAIGDGRPYNVALIVPDPDVLSTFNGGVLEEVERAVSAGNARLSRIEQVKRYAVVEDQWQPGSDELTPTLKLRRRPIRERYAAVIDQLYEGETA